MNTPPPGEVHPKVLEWTWRNHPQRIARVLRTFDTEREARAFADAEHRAGKRVGVMATLEWNRYHADHPTRTADRFVVYCEITHTEEGA